MGIYAGKPGLLAEIKITTAAAVVVAHTSLCGKNLAVLPRIDQWYVLSGLSSEHNSRHITSLIKAQLKETQEDISGFM